MGGSADLTPSNNTHFPEADDFQKDTPEGRYIRFGVREHAMGAILNGISISGLLRAYGGTFLVFSDYMRGAVRVAALSKYPSIFVWTHDSIGIGEDGPTHQPVEHFAALRAIPNLLVFRPADANETAQAWKYALEHRDGPVGLLADPAGRARDRSAQIRLGGQYRPRRLYPDQSGQARCDPAGQRLGGLDCRWRRPSCSKSKGSRRRW